MRLLSTFTAMLAAGMCLATTASAAGPTLTPPMKAPVGPPAAISAAPVPGPDMARPLTAPDVEAWLDGYMPYALKSGDVAGAVVVVVKDGQVVVQKGYGYADLKTRTLVDPAKTLFRPGSTSKLFTWTAVMQQVEQGKIDLDADINTYLDFKMPPGPGGKPITMRDLMTHTAGFEEALKNLISEDTKNVPTIGAYLKAWTPKRIFEAGTTPAYSNYATALAGHVVERVSGVDFDTYVERNIFAPLGMKYASFRQPLPAALQPYMATGYERASSGEAKKFEVIPASPAGALSASGADMAQFMIAHLQNGAFGASRILGEETAKTMHSTTRTFVPPLNRMALGFYEQNTNGRRVIAHGGDTQWFHTVLLLWPDDNVGLYISVNSPGKEGAAGRIRSELLREFADRYLPGPGLTGQVDAKTAAEHAKMISGSWENTRRAESSLLSFSALLGGVKVTPNKDGTISASLLRDASGAPTKWREVQPFVWVEEGGKSRLAAKVEDGKIVRWSADDFSPFMMFERQPATKAISWLVPATVAALAALLLTVVLWPVTAIVRRRYGGRFALEGREATAFRLVRIGAAASALTIVAWGAIVTAMFSELALLNGGMDLWLYVLQVLGSLFVLAGFVIAVWNAWIVWRGKRSWFAKLWSAVLVVSTFILLWLAVVYHLVGFNVNY